MPAGKRLFYPQPKYDNKGPFQSSRIMRSAMVEQGRTDRRKRAFTEIDSCKLNRDDSHWPSLTGYLAYIDGRAESIW